VGLATDSDRPPRDPPAAAVAEPGDEAGRHWLSARAEAGPALDVGSGGEVALLLAHEGVESIVAGADASRLAAIRARLEEAPAEARERVTLVADGLSSLEESSVGAALVTLHPDDAGQAAEALPALRRAVRAGGVLAVHASYETHAYADRAEPAALRPFVRELAGSFSIEEAEVSATGLGIAARAAEPPRPDRSPATDHDQVAAALDALELAHRSLRREREEAAERERALLDLERAAREREDELRRVRSRLDRLEARLKAAKQARAEARSEASSLRRELKSTQGELRRAQRLARSFEELEKTRLFRLQHELRRRRARVRRLGSGAAARARRALRR
jgi:hypothetical protein